MRQTKEASELTTRQIILTNANAGGDSVMELCLEDKEPRMRILIRKQKIPEPEIVKALRESGFRFGTLKPSEWIFDDRAQI